MVIEHVIAGYSIPHNEGAIPLTKESYDINNPQKRSSDFSKTITIPEDTLTNQIFEHAFDANVSFQTFDPNKKTSYQIFQDGILLMDGYCQLRDIKNVDGKIVYNIQAIGKAGNVFESIKDLYLTDLDFSAYNHVWDYTNVVASWTPTIGQGYVYPMIDLGGRTNYKEWKVTDFKPAFFVREYFTKIFSEQGYTINSTFFDTTLFKSLIVPYVSDSIPVANNTIKAKSFSAGLIASYTIPSGGLVIFDDTSAPYYNTSGNDYNSVTGKFTVPSNDVYAYQGLISLDLTYVNSNSNETRSYNYLNSQSDFHGHLNWFVYENVSGTIVDSGQLNITKYTKNVTLVDTGTVISNIQVGFQTNSFNATTNQEYTFNISSSPYYDGGLRGTPALVNGMTVDLLVGSNIQLNLKSVNYKDRDTLIMDSVIPKKIKQTDFISSIIKRFNLYLDYDSIDENLIHIEPREDYLLDTSDDLTEMVDRSKDVDIKPLGALDANTYLFTDKEDKDRLNAEHQDAFDSVYGERKIEVDNDFVKNEKVITSIFSPTPLETIKGQNDRVLSSVRFEDDNGNKTSGESKIRLLYWGGTLPTSEFWIFRFTTGVGVGANTFLYYPYAGHLDNPYAPTFDLNWGVPYRLYYDFNFGGSNIVTYPNNNCYNLFWREYIQEITDKDSRLLECYIALRPLDYANLSFRYKYYIDGSFWRLLKVIDYDANANQTTKCIFLKAEPQAAFTSQTPEILGGDDVFDNGEDYPTFRDLSRPNDSYGNPQDSLIYGDNVKASQRSIIVSNNITSGAGLSNVTALASDGSTISASNATLINSPDTEVTRDGSTYINGIFIENKILLNIPNSILSNMSGELEILPEVGADEFYEVVRGYARLNGVAANVGKIVDIETIPDSVSLMKIPASFFNVDNNVVYLERTPKTSTDLFFGRGVKLSSASNMVFAGGTTTLSIELIYRIVKF
tara:strand:- start:72 stop:2939 length:2868 start_codon:yes stop_codon:yes gene_type:complete